MVNGEIEIEVEELEDLIALAAHRCAIEHEEFKSDFVMFVAADIVARINCHLTGEVLFTENELKEARETRERFYINKALRSMEGGE